MSAGMLGFTIANAAAGGSAVVYIGQAADLTLSIVNATGDAIALPGDGSASLTVFLPDFYSDAEIAAINPDTSAAAGWTVDTGDGAITLTYAGPAMAWTAGAALTVGLAEVATAHGGAVTNKQAQVNPAGLPGLKPQFLTPLALIAATVAGNLPLAGALRLAIEDQTGVFVSTEQDPLANQLVLSVTNLTEAPLWTTAAPRPGQRPTLKVSFVYGSTVGALLPASGSQGTVGSAWSISAIPTDLSGGTWQVFPTSAADLPEWQLYPDDQNPAILASGGGASGSVSFTFSNIVSYLAPGHTRMVVHAVDFVQSPTVAYDDTVFYLDVVKYPAPDVRGVIRFTSAQPNYAVASPQDEVAVTLRWTLSRVSRIALRTNVPGVVPFTKTYSADGSPPPSLMHDATTVRLNGLTHSTMPVFTLQAYDGTGAFLNALQFVAYVEAQMFTDPADQRSYPGVRIGDQLWTTADLARACDGSRAAANPATGGRVYTHAAAGVVDELAGWRLPTVDDFNRLTACLGPDAWDTLTSGPFSAVPTGLGSRINGADRTTDSADCFFWTATPAANGYVAIQLSARNRTVTTTSGLAGDVTYLAVRYVREAP